MAKDRYDREGYLIGNGDYHVDYYIEDMANYPVDIQVQKSSSTESVYVHYRNREDFEQALRDDFETDIRVATVRFSHHTCNGLRFGHYLPGDSSNNRIEILYRLGFAVRNVEEVYSPYIHIAPIAKKKAAQMELCPFTLAELRSRGTGADLSDVKGTVISQSNGHCYIILDAVVGQSVTKKVSYSLK